MDYGNLTAKAAKGFSVGVGVFGSTYVGNTIADNTELGNTGVAAGEAVVGMGAAVLSDELGNQLMRFDRRLADIASFGAEHVGYGIMGAGVAEAADNMQTGAGTQEYIQVDSRDTQTAQAATDGGMEEEEEQQRARAYSLDTA